MMTIHEVSKLAGVSVRTLHHYDAIGLLPPTALTEAGYRLYDDTALARLQSILLFRELEFPLKDIKRILDDPNFDQSAALEDQIKLLELRRKQLGKLIALARETLKTGVTPMRNLTHLTRPNRRALPPRSRKRMGAQPRIRNTSSARKTALPVILPS